MLVMVVLQPCYRDRWWETNYHQRCLTITRERGKKGGGSLLEGTVSWLIAIPFQKRLTDKKERKREKNVLFIKKEIKEPSSET